MKSTFGRTSSEASSLAASKELGDDEASACIAAKFYRATETHTRFLDKRDSTPMISSPVHPESALAKLVGCQVKTGRYEPMAEPHPRSRITYEPKGGAIEYYATFLYRSEKYLAAKGFLPAAEAPRAKAAEPIASAPGGTQDKDKGKDKEVAMPAAAEASSRTEGSGQKRKNKEVTPGAGGAPAESESQAQRKRRLTAELLDVKEKRLEAELQDVRQQRREAELMAILDGADSQS